MFKRIKRTSLILGIALAVILGLSYGAFIFSTDKYRSSELLISKLNYSIDITEDGSSKSSINGSSVTVPANTKVYLNITLTSVNEIDSKYTLAYKTTSNAKVEYSDRTQWNTQGVIKGIDSNTYSKKIRVVIDNTDISTSSTVNFQVYGGYSFNSYANIELTDGYVSVSGPYTEVATNIGNRLVDIIESDTSCLTSSSSTCLYGGDNIKNYVQYPENEDKTKNLWRIIGSYQIDDQTLPKLISQSITSTSTSTLTTDLTSFYNTLEDKEVLVQETNKFNCFTSTCVESTYNNIGLLTDYEYNQIGGVNSYLASNENYYINSSNGIKEVTSSGITASSNTSGLKPTIYLQTGVQVTGSGTVSDPYIISQASDINLVSYTLDGQSTDKTYEWLSQNKLVDSITCQNGSVAEWDYSNNWLVFKTVKAPDYCTLDFKDGYTVTVNATNGTVAAPVSKSVGNSGSLSFTVTPNDGYIYESDTCSGSYSGNTYTVNNITSTKTCTITFKKNGTSLATLIQTNAVNENGYRYEGKDPNNYIQMEKTDGAKETWRIIGLFPDGASGENVIRVRKYYEKNSYPTMAFNLKNENYWPSTSMYSTLKDIYSISNYNNTVNFVMYLGAASSSSFSLTASGIYTTERGNTAGATSATSYASAVQTIGSVGLMYASDFTYAAVESDCVRTTKLYDYGEVTACHDNNWLYQGSNQTHWSLTTYSNSSYFVTIVRDDGRVDYRKSSADGGWPTVTVSTIAYSPVMALKSDVVVTGSGTQNDPYVMQ